MQWIIGIPFTIGNNSLKPLNLSGNNIPIISSMFGFELELAKWEFLHKIWNAQVKQQLLLYKGHPIPSGN